MFLSIPMIQMLKAGSPAVTFFAGVVLGAEAFSGAQFFNVLIICAGVLCSAYASVDLHLLGMVLQLASIVCDSLRCSLLQRTMARAGAKMNPMAALAEFAPRAAVLLVLPTLIFDLPVVWASPLCIIQSWPLIAASCAVAFLLNVAICALIGATSALTTSISGVLKDFACIVIAMLVHNVPITPLQWLGYAVSLVGLVWHHYRNVFGRCASGANASPPAGAPAPSSAPAPRELAAKAEQGCSAGDSNAESADGARHSRASDEGALLLLGGAGARPAGEGP
jgi:drug/metabolite transporter (DMT)-like permease